MALPYTSNKLYGNCKVLSPDDVLMFRCNIKKINWYLDRNIADLIDRDPLTIRLKFKPKGLGNNGKYGLTEMMNICVICGSSDKLSRHHIVPHCYRRYFPIERKSHNFHDVVPLCVNCHEEYEKWAQSYKILLSQKYLAPINGELINNKEILRLKRLASCLVEKRNKIPNKRISEIKQILKLNFGWKKISKKRLNELINSNLKVYNRTHGEIVVSKLDNIDSFIKEWRSHFIQNTECKFLPKNWSIDNE
jgi:exonuclease 3'-5' domain-containing protein 2